MADETNAADLAQDIAPASGGDQGQSETILDDIDPEVLDEIAGAGQEDEDEAELDELDFGFKKYQVPKSLKRAVEDWRASTTKKEQDVSARAKTLDSRESEIEQRLSATEEELDTRAELRQVSRLLDEYTKLSPEDWARLRSESPMETDNHWTQFQFLKDQKAALEGKIGDASKKRETAQSEDLTKRVKDTSEFAAKNIPGFSQKQIDTLIAHATDLGIDEATTKRFWSPTFYKLLFQSHLGQQLLERQAKARKAPANDDTTPPPLKTVKANASSAPGGLSDKLSADEWVKRRNAQLAAGKG